MVRDCIPKAPRFLLLPLAFLLLLAGCREELGPEHFPTTRVSGAVEEGGRPVGGGWIEFVPMEVTLGRIRSAKIQTDGSFQTDGVPIGKCLIRLVNAPIQFRGGRKLFGNYSTSPVRRVIPEQPGKPLKIDLLEEAVRFQAMRSRAAESRWQQPATGGQP